MPGRRRANEPTRKTNARGARTPQRTPAAERLEPQGHGGALKRKQKVAVETPAETPMRTPAHGNGRLRVGGTNKGGPGAPPSLIRDGMRGSYQQRWAFLDSVIDGDLIVQTAVPLAAIVPHVYCANCAYRVVPKDVEDLFLLTIPGMTSASVKERILALEQLARYSLGALKEVSVDNVRDRVSQTLTTIRELCEPAQAETIFRALEPIWA